MSKVFSFLERQFTNVIFLFYFENIYISFLASSIASVGAAYIYTLNNAQWTLSASIISPSTYLSNSLGLYQSKFFQSYFGYSVAVYRNFAVIGAPLYSK